jgi:hypothetical protein
MSDTEIAIQSLLSMKNKYDREEITIANEDIEALLNINNNSVFIDILPSPCLTSSQSNTLDISSNFTLTPSSSN